MSVGLARLREEPEAIRQGAIDKGEDPSLVDAASEILHQPGDSLPHDDHLHLRIACPDADRLRGCVDKGPTRTWRRRIDPDRPPEADLVAALRRLPAPPFLLRKGFVP